MLHEILDAVGDPSHGVFDTAGNVPIRLVRPNRHEEVGEVLNRQSEIGAGPIPPYIAQRDVVDATEIDGLKRARDCRLS